MASWSERRHGPLPMLVFAAHAIIAIMHVTGSTLNRLKSAGHFQEFNAAEQILPLPQVSTDLTPSVVELQGQKAVAPEYQSFTNSSMTRKKRIVPKLITAPIGKIIRGMLSFVQLDAESTQSNNAQFTFSTPQILPSEHLLTQPSAIMEASTHRASKLPGDKEPSPSYSSTSDSLPTMFNLVDKRSPLFWAVLADLMTMVILIAAVPIILSLAAGRGWKFWKSDNVSAPGFPTDDGSQRYGSSRQEQQIYDLR